MKIEREKLDKYIKAILSLPYHPVGKSSFLFFPIENKEVLTSNGLELSLSSNKEMGVTKEPTAGIILDTYLVKDKEGKSSEKVCANLAYADITYCPKFNLHQYVAIYGRKFKEKDLLKEIDCVLVKDTAILAKFEI